MTSMQRSFLGDVSPPSSMGSPSSYNSRSIVESGVSLINSNDFSSINYFMSASNTFDPLHIPKFSRQIVEDALFDTSSPALEDESIFNDVCINEPQSATFQLSSDTLTKSMGCQMDEPASLSDRTNATVIVTGDEAADLLCPTIANITKCVPLCDESRLQVGDETFELDQLHMKNGTFDLSTPELDVEEKELGELSFSVFQPNMTRELSK